MKVEKIPWHFVFGLPECPGRHSQEKLPGVLVQIAFEPHCPDGPKVASHSLISEKQNRLYFSFKYYKYKTLSKIFLSY